MERSYYVTCSLYYVLVVVISVFARSIVKNVLGEVFAKRVETIDQLSTGHKIKEHDIIITKQGSSIGIIFEDGTIISLGENSILSINKYLFRPSQKEFSFDVDMSKGLASFESGKIGKLSPQSVKFRVPEGTVGIRGTKFYVEVK